MLKEQMQNIPIFANLSSVCHHKGWPQSGPKDSTSVYGK